MKIRCIIVEDEPKALMLLQEYVAQVPYLELVYATANPVEALNLASKEAVDLIFLDINLPGLSGLELAGLLKERVKIIFTTAYSEFAVQSYEQNAVDYLLKPITFNRFLKATQKAKATLATPGEKEKQQDTFLVKSGKKVIQLHWSNICYIEGTKEYVTLVSPESRTIIYKRMKEFEALQPPGLIRIHNSYFVNVSFIRKIEDNHVYVQDIRIPIGKKYRDSFQKYLQERYI